MREPFKLHQKVTILELKRPGRVTAILRDNDGTTFRVRYFFDGVARDVYFYPDELKSLA